MPEGEYLNLMELGEILSELAYQSPYDRGMKSILKSAKHYQYVIEKGQVNLISVDTGTYKAIIIISNVLAILASVWKAILFLYMADPTQSLPTYEVVVICTEETTVEEVGLFIQQSYLLTSIMFGRLLYFGIVLLMMKKKDAFFVL